MIGERFSGNLNIGCTVPENEAPGNGETPTT